VNAIVKNHEETERKNVQCGPFCKLQTSLKCSPLEKLEAALVAWLKQARECKASIDGTHLKEKGLHIAAHVGIPNFLDSSEWIYRFKRRYNIVLLWNLNSGLLYSSCAWLMLVINCYLL
jgi:hypothetical protein